MVWIFALPLAICAVPITLATSALWETLAASPYAHPFFVGVALGILVGIAILRYFPLLFVLDHELTHFVAALLILRKPLMIAAEAKAGVVILEGRGSTFVSLAPHSIPVLSLTSLLLLLIVDEPSRPWVVGLIGLTWGYHGVTDLFDAVTGGSDLTKVGNWASRTIILSSWVILYPLVVVSALGGLDLVKNWFRTAWQLACLIGARIIELAIPFFGG